MAFISPLQRHDLGHISTLDTREKKRHYCFEMYQKNIMQK